METSQFFVVVVFLFVSWNLILFYVHYLVDQYKIAVPFQ